MGNRVIRVIKEIRGIRNIGFVFFNCNLYFLLTEVILIVQVVYSQETRVKS